WQHYSPMTGEEILELGRYCQERFIDLVPNQNSFGHLKEWLVHDPYKHLAEVEDGWMGWGHWFEGPFSLSPAVPETIPFLASLYDELLPHFNSPYFNVGCDETFDVGQGKSKETVAQNGGHRVYLDQLLKIHRLVRERGRIMQFWGDIIIQAPECIAELPKDLVALEWGYEANHPYDEHCRQFAAAGVPFYVCPGTSTWLTLAGRTENALGSMKNAARAGLTHGAIGFLNTIWGDRGHQDYQPVTYLPLAFGAAISWCTAANESVDVTPYLNQFIFGDHSARMGQFLFDLGNVYRVAGKRPGNASILGLILLDSCDRPQILDGVTASDLDRAAAEIQRVAQDLSLVELTCQDGPLVLAEMRNTVRMLLHACELGKLQLRIRTGETIPAEQVRALLTDLDGIVAEHRRLWLQRNRIGGLMEMSLLPLLKVRALYTSLLKA
ncbi:MAG: family 20 glycosylhydrolase, partial [Mycobacterium leprae]